MDRAILAIATVPNGLLPLSLHAPISAEPYLARLWQAPGRFELAAKGAPESLISLCGLTGDAARAVIEETQAMAQDGQRVLAVAWRTMATPDRPTSDFEIRFSPGDLCGLVGFIDPVRTEVPRAVRACRAAGIRVVMITGDYPATAAAIAAEAELGSGGPIVSGLDLLQADKNRRAELVRRTNVFARIQPEQKLQIVEALRAAGEVVAMTGDGVNDAPALKMADIGIAMGRRGTDLARQSADLVLLDDRFSSIVVGVAMGRRIFANLRRALIFVTAIHVPIAGVSIVPLVLGLPPLLLPMHVVLMEMVVDPLCSLAFEAEGDDRNAMLRPPRRSQDRLFTTRQLAQGALAGGVLLLAVASSYVVALQLRVPEATARTLSYLTLGFGNLAMAAGSLPSLFSLKAWADRRMFAVVAGGSSLALLAIAYLPVANRVFQTAPLDLVQLAFVVVLASFGGGAVPTIAKVLAGRKDRLGPG